jgi:hypothetical protein
MPLQLYTPHVLMCYKNFAANQNISHIGLGVAALNIAKVLRKHGIMADVFPVLSALDIATRLKADPTITHVVISAAWIQSADLAGTLLRAFPNVEFAVNVHSNVGFLQADTNGVKLIRQYIDLEQGSLNFRISANSRKGVLWLRTAYQCPATYLPNLYYLDYSVLPTRPLWNGGTLYIGAFGAQRILKNLMSAAGAALEIANWLKADVKFYMNSGRADGGNSVTNSIAAMLSGVGNITLVQVNWNAWPQFRDTVRQMHLLMSVSYTESFNMVTADGVAEGVPSVVSDAIDWAPNYWKAPVDQTSEIARVGRQLISDPNAAKDGLTSLEQHNKDGFAAWCQLVGVSIPYQSLIVDPYLI